MWDEIAELLPVIAGEAAGPPADVLALVPTLSRSITEAVDTARMLRTEVDSLSENVDDLNDQVEALREWLRLPWWKRIRTPPLE